MAKIKVVGSGSKGNCYILECEDVTLILEIGLPYKQILPALDYNLNRKIYAICTHEHNDHINPQTLKHLTHNVIPVYSTSSASALYSGINALQDRKKYKMGQAVVMPLKVPHGDCECFAYYISHPEFGTLLFATDLSDFPYTIKNINHLLIETNNSEEVIMDNIETGLYPTSRHQDHLSLETALKVIKRHASPALQNILLLHLSRQNADENMFASRVVQTTGIQPSIAKPNVLIPLAIEEF